MTLRGIERVESVGSVWFFDAANQRYMRMPNHEGPRERPEWGDSRAGACEDHVWHAASDWWACDGDRRMVICPKLFEAFWVPLVTEVLDSTFDVDEELRRRRRERDERPLSG